MLLEPNIFQNVLQRFEASFFLEKFVTVADTEEGLVIAKCNR